MRQMMRWKQFFQRSWPALPEQQKMHPRERSLRRYIEHGLGLMVLIAVLVLGIGITTFVYQTEARSWRDRQSEAAISAAKSVSLFMQFIRDYMTIISRLDGEYLQNHGDAFQILLNQTPALLEIIRLDSEGKVMAGAHQEQALLANLFTIPQSNWFQQARSGQPYMGEVQISAADEPYLVLAIPASDGGVVAARLRMNVLWEVVSDIHFGQSGQSYIVSSSGQVVAYPDPQVVLSQVSIAKQSEFAQIRQAAGMRWHGNYRNFDNVLVVGSTTAIENSDWIIIIEVSQAEAYATTRLSLIVLGGGVMTAGLVMLLLGMRLMQEAIFQPVEHLRAGAERIGQGELDYRIDIYQQDEIGQVAEAFNEMAERLKDREQALKLARDEALMASQFKSRLLANVGHDLRTPINSILGFSEVMREGVYGPLNDQQQRAIDRVLSNTRRLLNLINSILDQAQIEAGKLVLRVDGFDPQELLNAVHETMDVPAQARHLELVSEKSSDLPTWIVGDQQRTQQMVMNLVENAVKFTKQGRVCVHMALFDSAHWSIEVEDTGPGIPPDAQSYIFDAFRQLDSSTTRDKKGVGLGLSIVKQITLLMNGELRLISEVGKGSKFIIILPLLKPEDFHE